MLQACLNGDRGATGPAGIAMTAAGVATEALAAATAGAGEFHLHPRDRGLRESMSAVAVAAAGAAVRRAVPGAPVGTTTGAWIEPDPKQRCAAIGGWTVLPDQASVNWHEDGADDVVRTLLDRGIAVEAGVFVDGADFVGNAARFAGSPRVGAVRRILIEVVEQDRALMYRLAEQAVAIVDELGIPILLHGEGESCWPMVELAVRLGLDTRIGFEDTLTLPYGDSAWSNGDLVAAAVRLGAR